MDTHPKILVVYFTRGGNTERLAQSLATALNAHCERIRERDDRSRRLGVTGFLRSLRDVLMHRPAPILSAQHEVALYDVVVIGTPVWAGRASTPVSTWLQFNREHLKSVAFFCSLNGRGAASAFADMQRRSGKSPLATCAVLAHDIDNDADRVPLDVFARRILDAASAPQTAQSVA